MESGLEGRNNRIRDRGPSRCKRSLNGVRPRRPEQSAYARAVTIRAAQSLNGVRPRRPEQLGAHRRTAASLDDVSMESGLEGRNNESATFIPEPISFESQWSPA